MRIYRGSRLMNEFDDNSQSHNHEIQGSVMLAEFGNDRHNHRFCTMSGEAVWTSTNEHFHNVSFTTDFAGHFHTFQGRTGPAIKVGNGKHVHLLEGMTNLSDNHRHEFNTATLIENPLNLC